MRSSRRFRMLPPSPNWYLANICSLSSTGILAWGASKTVVLMDGKNRTQYNFIGEILSHKITVTCVKFAFFNGAERLIVVSEYRLDLCDFKTRKTAARLELGFKCRALSVAVTVHEVNRLVLVGFEKGMILAWNPLAGVEVALFKTAHAVTALAASPHDPELFVAGLKSGSILLHHLDGNVLRRFEEHSKAITSLCFRPKTKSCVEPLFCSGSQSGELKIWDTNKEDSLDTYNLQPRSQKGRKSNRFWVASVWHQENHIVASSTKGHTHFIDLETRTMEYGADVTETSLIFCLAYHPAFPAYTFSVHSIRKVILHNIQTRKPVWTLCCLGGCAYSVAFAPWAPKLLMVGCSDKIRLWWVDRPAGPNTTRNVWRNIKDKVTCVTFHPAEEDWFAFGLNTGRVAVQNLSNHTLHIYCAQHRKAVLELVWRKLREFQPAPGNVRGKELEDTGWRLYSMSGDGVIFESHPLHVKKVRRVEKIISACNDGLPAGRWTSLAFSEVHQLFALGHSTGAVFLFDDDFKAVMDFQIQSRLVSRVRWHPCPDPNGKCYGFLACASDDHTVAILTAETDPDKVGVEKDGVVSTYSGHNIKVVTIDWKPSDDDIILSGGFDGVIAIWNVFTSEELLTFNVNHGRIMSAIWSAADADVLYIASDDGSMREVRCSNLSLKQAKQKPVTAALKPHRKGLSLHTSKAVPLEASIPPSELNLKLKEIVKAEQRAMEPVYDSPRKIREVIAERLKQRAPTKPLVEQDARISSQSLAHVLSGELQAAVAEEFRTGDGLLDPIWLALAPALGKDVWCELVEIQVKLYCQLRQWNTAVLLLLSLGEDRVREAIDVYIKAGYMAEALALAVHRLDDNDPLLANIYKEWAMLYEKNREYEEAAKCWLRIGQKARAVGSLLLQGNFEFLCKAYRLAFALDIPNKEEIERMTLVQCFVLRRWDCVDENHALGPVFAAHRIWCASGTGGLFQELRAHSKPPPDAPGTLRALDGTLEVLEKSVHQFSPEHGSAQVFHLQLFAAALRWVWLSAAGRRGPAVTSALKIAELVKNDASPCFPVMRSFEADALPILESWSSDAKSFVQMEPFCVAYASFLAVLKGEPANVESLKEVVENHGESPAGRLCAWCLSNLKHRDLSEKALSVWAIMNFSYDLDPQLRQYERQHICEAVLWDVLDI